MRSVNFEWRSWEGPNDSRLNCALLFIVILAVVPLVALTQNPPPADLILHNGVIWTVDSKNSTVEAVAIREGKFVVVGTNKDALSLRGPKTQVIDLRGRFVTPGFNDNHVHFASAAQFLEFNIMNVASTDGQEQFVARVKDVTSRLAKGEWIVGGFWGAYDQWTAGSAGGNKREPLAPNMSLVEEITADYPMFIRKFDDTLFAANRAALRALKIDPDNPSAPDVEFLKDSQGRFNGLMRGRGVTRLFASLVPRTFSRDRRIQQDEERARGDSSFWCYEY